jgi:hypothetical protein
MELAPSKRQGRGGGVTTPAPHKLRAHHRTLTEVFGRD